MEECKKKSWKDIVQTAGGLVFVFIGISLLWVASAHASIGAPTNFDEVEITGMCLLTLNTGEQLAFKIPNDGNMNAVMVESAVAMDNDHATGFWLDCRQKGKSIKAELQQDRTAIANYCIASNNHDSQRFTGETLEAAVSKASSITDKWEKRGTAIVTLDCQGEGTVIRLSLNNDPVFHKITKEEK